MKEKLLYGTTNEYVKFDWLFPCIKPRKSEVSTFDVALVLINQQNNL